MSIRLLLLLLTVLSLRNICLSQNIPVLDNQLLDSSSFKLIQTIPGIYSYLNVDPLGKIYVINSKNQLQKQNEKGETEAVYADINRNGIPACIDVSNPFKTIVYYKKYGTVVTLDRLLSNINTINLNTKGLNRIKIICTSYDNNLWLYDPQDSKIKKINAEGNVTMESNSLSTLEYENPDPNIIVERDKKLILYDKKRGFFVFDLYCTYNTFVQLPDLKYPTISDNTLFGFSDSLLYTYSFSTLLNKSYLLPSFMKDKISIVIINNKLYLLKQAGLYIYQIESR